MKTLSTLVFLSLFGLLACKDCDQCPEPNYEYDPTDPRYICKAPDIAKNIVGSWKFETNLDSLGRIRTGYVTFDASGRMIDPDSLIENRLDAFDEPIVAKTYAIKEGKVETYQFLASTLLEPVRLVQIYRFIIKENSCNRIELILNLDTTYIKLTR